MSGPWFSYGRPHSYGRRASYGVPSSYGRSASTADEVAESGDPMLTEGLAATREALLAPLSVEARGKLAHGATRRWAVASDELPEFGQVERLDQQGADVRAALVHFEVLSSLSFQSPTKPSEWAILKGGDDVLVQGRRPDQARFLDELDRIQAQAPLRAARAPEILTQIAPPHAYFGAILGLQGGRHPHTQELVEAALAVAYAVGQRFKLALAVPRPTEYSAQIQPMIEVPQHASYPAGHAVEAHLTARLLTALCGANAEQAGLLRNLAGRVAENRIVAGVHFPVDCRFGRLIGDCLASYLLSACGVGEPGGYNWRGGSFDGGAPGDFGPTSSPFDDDLDGKLFGSKAPYLPLFARLWERARTEWPAPTPAVKEPAR